jgi:septal ring factor EnvC (AmiA/AmiB activator)
MKKSLSDAAKLMSAKPLPVVELFRQLSSVDDAADAVLAGTQDAVKEEAVRIERAARLVRDIEGRIGDHRRYFKNHRGDLSPAITNALGQVEADFDTLKRERSVAQTITLGAQLEAALDQVDRAAKQAVRKAEAEREEKRRAAEAARRRREDDEADERRRSSSYTSSGFGSSSGSDSSSSSFGGGSSSYDSGGSSSFGGGSSSW